MGKDYIERVKLELGDICCWQNTEETKETS